MILISTLPQIKSVIYIFLALVISISDFQHSICLWARTQWHNPNPEPNSQKSLYVSLNKSHFGLDADTVQHSGVLNKMTTDTTMTSICSMRHARIRRIVNFRYLSVYCSWGWWQNLTKLSWVGTILGTFYLSAVLLTMSCAARELKNPLWTKSHSRLFLIIHLIKKLCSIESKSPDEGMSKIMGNSNLRYFKDKSRLPGLIWKRAWRGNRQLGSSSQEVTLSPCWKGNLWDL